MPNTSDAPSISTAMCSGHTLVCLYADEGISGTKIPKRVELQRLMRDAETGLFDMVVVKDISRLRAIRSICCKVSVS